MATHLATVLPGMLAARAHAGHRRTCAGGDRRGGRIAVRRLAHAVGGGGGILAIALLAGLASHGVGRLPAHLLAARVAAHPRTRGCVAVHARHAHGAALRVRARPDGRLRRLHIGGGTAGGRGIEHELDTDLRFPVLAGQCGDAPGELALDPVQLEAVGRSNPQRVRFFIERNGRQRLDPRFELLRRQFTLELRGCRLPEILHCLLFSSGTRGSRPGHITSGAYVASTRPCLPNR
ncbi:hypothetical protein D9M72_368870 [compost metagenome]